MRGEILFRFDNRQIADLVAEQSRGLVYGLRVVSCKTQIVLGPNDKKRPWYRNLIESCPIDIPPVYDVDCFRFESQFIQLFCVVYVGIENVDADMNQSSQVQLRGQFDSAFCWAKFRPNSLLDKAFWLGWSGFWQDPPRFSNLVSRWHRRELISLLAPENLDVKVLLASNLNTLRYPKVHCARSTEQMPCKSTAVELQSAWPRASILRWTRFLNHWPVKISGVWQELVGCYRGCWMSSIFIGGWSPIYVFVAQARLASEPSLVVYGGPKQGICRTHLFRVCRELS